MKTVTFGEIMLRLQPPSYKRILQTGSYEATYGGGEANVAVSLAQFGDDARFVTVLPANPVADACKNELRRWGVDISRIVTGDGRMGIYFCEKGASQRPSVVVYDRKYSAISLAKPGDIDWDGVFEDADWFHFTGITPALGDSVFELCLEAVKKAKEKGITVSCDLNYRREALEPRKGGKVHGRALRICRCADCKRGGFLGCVRNKGGRKRHFGRKALG